MWRNDQVGIGYRATLGVISWLRYTLFPDRVFGGLPIPFVGGGDHFNPFSNTVHVFSSDLAILLHEGGHAKVYVRHRARGTTFVLLRLLPGIDLIQEAVASPRNPDLLRETVRAIAPDVIVNAAAYTAVDRAESEPELARTINAIAPGVLAEEAQRLNAILVHYSTDYVLDGTKSDPYVESDPTNPLNVYGRTKLEGERAIGASGCRHLTLRTSWVYGARGSNFLLTMLRLARERRQLRVVDDQVGAPTWSREIAQATAALLARPELAARGAEGLYHLTASGQTSWYGFARAIFDSPEIARLGVVSPVLEAIPASAYPTPARRSAN